jgi:L-lactate utilization protein LutB
MDQNMDWMYRKKIERTMENLEKNNMEAFLVEDENELIEMMGKTITQGSTVSVGGSMTLFETGVIDFLRSGKFNFLDRYADGLSPEDMKQLFRDSFSANFYFTSTNAVTETGTLYNVDGTGNRTAAMIYGPDNIIVIVGINKLVTTEDEAIERNREVSGPANAKRLSRKTPCTELGYCTDCTSPDRICNSFTFIKRQGAKGRIKVYIVNKDLGY